MACCCRSCCCSCCSFLAPDATRCCCCCCWSFCCSFFGRSRRFIIRIALLMIPSFIIQIHWCCECLKGKEWAWLSRDNISGKGCSDPKNTLHSHRQPRWFCRNPRCYRPCKMGVHKHDSVVLYYDAFSIRQHYDNLSNTCKRYPHSLCILGCSCMFEPDPFYTLIHQHCHCLKLV